MDSGRVLAGGGTRRGHAAIPALVVLFLASATALNVTRSDSLVEARRAYARSDLVASLQHALDHLERQPWSREAALLAARCLSRRDYPDQAEPYFQRAGSLSLSDLQLRAYGLARGPHPDRAIRVLGEVLERSPDNVAALRRLAAVLLSHGDAPRLLEVADRLARTPSGEVYGAMLRGTVYHNMSNPQRAVAAFERVLELDPELREMPSSRKLFWDQLASDLVDCGRIEEASKRLEQALAGFRDAELMDLLGYIYFLQGRFDDARQCYRQSAEWDPNFYRPHLNLAKLDIQLRHPDEALRELTLARARAPRSLGVLTILSQLYHQLGKEADARQTQRDIEELRRQATKTSAGERLAGWPRYAL